ncbi:MAG: hypothetical protein H7282_17345 [Cytophagaceae bacterium]|nr:hypothetical protein [Cytophagaceae bacterium]
MNSRLKNPYGLILILQADSLFTDVLLEDRIPNEEQITTIVNLMESLMTEQSTMTSLSCAYLPGDKGVLNLLMEKGYKVRAVIPLK